MFLLDSYANNSRLRHIHPGEKASFTLLCLTASLFFSRMAVSASVLLLTALLILLVAKIPARNYGALLLLPASFLLLGSLAVALETSPSASPAFFALEGGGLYLGISQNSMHLALALLLRSLAAVSGMCFLALTTPFAELGWLLRRIKVPPVMIELAGLTYRLIFILAETSARIYSAQASRLGYSTWRNAIKSLGVLTAGLYIRSFYRSQLMHQALQSRCYDGDFKTLEMYYRISPANWLFIICAAFFFMGAGYLLP